MLIRILFAFILIFLVGCSLDSVDVAKPEFIDYYQRQKSSLVDTTKTGRADEKLLTISTQDMPLTEFLRWLSNSTGISVVCSVSIDDRPVTVDIVHQGVDGILSVVARRLGVQVTRAANVYYLGSLGPEDRGVLVRRVSRLRGPELTESVKTLLSENGRAVAFDDGLVVVGDKVEILQRVNELFEGIENAPADSWFVQTYLLSFHTEKMMEYGIDVSIDAVADIAIFGGGDTRDGFFSLAIKAAQSDSLVSILTSPFFVIADGGSASYVSGQNVPIPRRTVSDAGTVSTTGFDFQQTGLQFGLSLRQAQQGKAHIEFAFESSTIVDYIDVAPVTLTEKFTSSFSIIAGDPYLVGSVNTVQESNRVKGWGSQKRAEEGDILQVWVRAYKID